MIQIALVVLFFSLPAAAFQSVNGPMKRYINSNSNSKLSLSNDPVADKDSLMARRSFCAQSLATFAGSASILSSSPSISYAAESIKLENYNDIDYGFTVSVPSSWENTDQKLSGRRKAVFFTDPNSKDAETDTVSAHFFLLLHTNLCTDICL